MKRTFTMIRMHKPYIKSSRASEVQTYTETRTKSNHSGYMQQLRNTSPPPQAYDSTLRRRPMKTYVCRHGTQPTRESNSQIDARTLIRTETYVKHARQATHTAPLGYTQRTHYEPLSAREQQQQQGTRYLTTAARRGWHCRGRRYLNSTVPPQSLHNAHTTAHDDEQSTGDRRSPAAQRQRAQTTRKQRVNDAKIHMLDSNDDVC